MPSRDVGQISFSAEGQQFALLMTRTDFDRLAKRMRALLREVPPLLQKRGRPLHRMVDDRRQDAASERVSSSVLRPRFHAGVRVSAASAHIEKRSGQDAAPPIGLRRQRQQRTSDSRQQKSDSAMAAR
jgi:hypothetical protein